MAVVIGVARCPLCGSEKARLSLSRSSLPVLTCSGCHAQIFARGDRSDALLRGFVVERAAQAATPVPAPVASPPPAPATEPPPKPPKRGTGSAFDALLNLGGAS